MREIKFRAWHESNNEMISQRSSTVSEAILFWKSIYYDAKLMQYTGLKDKNGVEIYEGDIIKNYQADKNEVFWYNDGSWCMSNYHAGALSLGEYSSVSEVIGNIYKQIN